MKKFILFAYDYWYPMGGLKDIAGDFQYLDDAIKFVQTQDLHNDCIHVVDRDTWEIVWNGSDEQSSTSDNANNSKDDCEPRWHRLDKFNKAKNS